MPIAKTRTLLMLAASHTCMALMSSVDDTEWRMGAGQKRAGSCMLSYMCRCSYLNDNSLSGTIPGEALGQLNRLYYL